MVNYSFFVFIPQLKRSGHEMRDNLQFITHNRHVLRYKITHNILYNFTFACKR